MPVLMIHICGLGTQYEPGILINIYNLPSNFTGYQARQCSSCSFGHIVNSPLTILAGPAVWQG